MKTTHMNYLIKNTAVALLLLMAAFSCKPKFSDANPDPGPASGGSVDLSKYVAIGSTITAGFEDNALFTEGQNDAYPNLLEAKLREVNPASIFVQPDINSVAGWSGAANKGRSLLVIPACTSVTIGPVAQAGESSVLPYTGNPALVTNLAVPFLRVTDVNVGTASVTAGTAYNNPRPYFDRIFASTTLGIASEAKARNATFFTVFLGYTDALRYATSGGTTALVSTAVFQTNIENLLDSLLANPNAKGLIATIPYVDQFPVITNNNRRITSSSDPARNPIRLTATQAATYNTDLGVSIFSGAAGNKNYYAIQPGGGGTIRQMDPTKDFVVTASILNNSGIGKVDSAAARSCTPDNTARTEGGLSTPFADNAVLDKAEIVTLRAQIDAYNAAITAAVSARNASGQRIGIVNLNAFYIKLADPVQGITYGTTTVRANHPNLGPDFGGFYSLDRLTPTPRGQSLLANEFIKALNANFGANIHLYDPANFRINEIQ